MSQNESTKTINDLQQELDDCEVKLRDIMISWYGKPVSEEKKAAHDNFKEVMNQRNQLLEQAERLGYTYGEPEELGEYHVRYVLRMKDI